MISLRKDKTVESHEVVQASYDRCVASGDFFQTFYDIFLAKSPEIAAKFAQTDFNKQKNLIKASIAMMIRLGVGNENARRVIERVGDTHCRQALDIRPEFYDWWLDSLCEAVQRHDADYSAELEGLWRASMEEGITLVTSRY